MEKELHLSLLAISLLYILSFPAFCQQINNKVVGRYFVPDSVKDRIVEDYCIEFYSNYRFKYISNNNYLFGCMLETPGFWSVCGDTIILNSEVEELTIESMGNLEFPFENYTFKIFELEKGSVNWFDKCPPFQIFNFLTANNDTLRLAPNDDGIISINKDTTIVCIWANMLYVSNKVYMPSDRDLNFFIIKYSPYRQFDKEKWIIRDDGTINPIDRYSNRQADYSLQRDYKWDPDAQWEDIVPPSLRMHKSRICTLGN